MKAFFSHLKEEIELYMSHARLEAYTSLEGSLKRNYNIGRMTAFEDVLNLIKFYGQKYGTSRKIENKQKKIVYLANPYGFSEQQRKKLLPEIKNKIESLGYEVWEPFERNDQVEFSNPDWAYEIGQRDLEDVKNCDIFFGVVNGNPPDEGVMVELGVAIALKKPIYLFRDDFRKCSDSNKYPLNLMIFSGLDKVNWERHYFTSIDKINF